MPENAPLANSASKNCHCAKLPDAPAFPMPPPNIIFKAWASYWAKSPQEVSTGLLKPCNQFPTKALTNRPSRGCKS